MSEKRWIMAVLPGVGELAFWIESDFLEVKYTSEESETIKRPVENLTKIMPGPEGRIGFQRLNESAWIDMRQASVLMPVPKEMVPGLSCCPRRTIGLD